MRLCCRANACRNSCTHKQTHPKADIQLNISDWRLSAHSLSAHATNSSVPLLIARLFAARVSICFAGAAVNAPLATTFATRRLAGGATFSFRPVPTSDSQIGLRACSAHATSGHRFPHPMAHRLQSYRLYNIRCLRTFVSNPGVAGQCTSAPLF